jgi:hypothetical protein
MADFKLVWHLLLAAAFITIVHGDVIVTMDGNEITGKIVEVNDTLIRYIPDHSPSDTPEKISLTSVFMVKYNDGRKQVFSVGKKNKSLRLDNDEKKYSACVFLETGLFGLVNVKEEHFDPGVFTIGVTPCIDRKLNRYLSVGVEYMILWAKANHADDSRFIMNCNGIARLSFPMKTKLDFLAQVNAGLSIWPGAESTYQTDTTFFKDRIGWDFHGGIGMKYNISRNGSIVLFACYNANFSTLDEIPITIDMLIISLGPRIEF